MRRDEARLEQLLGLDRNKVQTGGEPHPAELLNLTDSRAGGITPVGDWHADGLDSLGSFRSVVGADARGLAGLTNAAGTGYALHDGSRLLTQGSTVAAGKTAHFPGVGLYRKRDQFFVLDQDGNPVSPFSYSGVGVVRDSSGVPDVQVGIDAPGVEWRDVAFDAVNDRWVAVGGNGSAPVVAVRDGDGAWAVSVVSGAPAGAFANRVVRSGAPSGSAWIVVGSHGLILRSVDAASWSVIAEPGGHGTHFKDIAVDGQGVVWLVGDRMYRSTNNGSLFSAYNVSFVDEGAMIPVAAAFSLELGRLFFLTASTNESMGAYYLYSAVAASGSDVMFYRNGYTGAGVRGMPMGAVREAGFFRPGRLLITGSRLVAVSNLVEAAGEALFGSTLEGFTITADDVVRDANAVAPTIVREGSSSAVWLFALASRGGSLVVGGAGNYLAESGNVGASWVELSPAGAAGASWRGVAIDFAGQVVAVSSAGNVTGLELSEMHSATAGAYEVMALVVLVTAGGKLVVDYFREEFTLAPGEKASISAGSVSGGAWASNVFVELFVRFQPRLFDERTGEYYIDTVDARDLVHAHTFSPGDAAWPLVNPTVGRVLGLGGPVGIAAAGGPLAALSNSRMWFQASAVDAEWVFPSGEVSVADLAGPDVIVYSEIGYVNLVSAFNYVSVPVAQSRGVTGFVASPGALLVFCDNEIFQVVGDPALQGSMQVSLYPDVVGLDASARPAVMGGVVVTVWQGKAWVLAGAQAQEFTKPVWLEADPVVAAVGDSVTRSFLVRTKSGRVFRYRVDAGFWCEDAATGRAVEFLPNPGGVRFVTAAGELRLVSPLPDKAVVSDVVPVVAWLGFDAGDAQRRDTWVGLRFTSENYQVNTASPPALEYATVSRSGSVVGRQYGEEVVFRLPWGVRGRRIDLRLTLNGLRMGDVVEPGVSIGFVPGQLSDRRPVS